MCMHHVCVRACTLYLETQERCVCMHHVCVRACVCACKHAGMRVCACMSACVYGPSVCRCACAHWHECTHVHVRMGMHTSIEGA